MITIKEVRAPVRIDFGGGTTDIYPFTHTHGGCVLNAGINRYVTGKIIKSDKKIHLEYTGNTPTSSGLGTSGVMNLVWLALISQINKKGGMVFREKKELAEQVYALEQAMGLVGGKQDQYAAAFGGINFLEFKKDDVKITQLKMNRSFVEEFNDKLVLVYTGKPHFSGDSNSSMIENLKKGKNTENFIALKNIAVKMKEALLKKDLDEFSGLMNQETQERKNLSKLAVNSHLQKFIDKGIRNGAAAAKVCGSGGGGSILFFTDKRNELKKAFKSKVIDFRFDFNGLVFR